MRQLVWLLLLGATANAAPRCLSAAEAQAAAGATPDLGARWTPPLPVSWPPAGAAAVRFFDLRSTALPTGIVSYRIDSPTLEVTVPLDGAPPRRRKLGKSTRLGTWTPPVDPARLELEAAAALVVRLSCEARGPTEAEATTIREGYRAWFLSEPLHRSWLTKETGPFLAWVAARPPPPPGTQLTARLESDAVILSRDGTEARLERPGLKSAQLFVVPLRADGSDPALWISYDDPKSGPLGLLVAFEKTPRVLFTHVPLTRQGGFGSTSRTAWLLDVDGDGLADLVQHATSHSDVGPQNEGAQVFLFDALSGTFVPSEKQKRAPRFFPDVDRRVDKRLAQALEVPRVELRGRLDPWSQRLTTPAAANTLGSGGSPPFVGPDALQLVLVKKTEQQLGGRYHLVQVHFDAEPSVVTTIDLGEVSFPMNGCEGRREDFRLEGRTVVVVWPSGPSLVEQRLSWDGKRLLPPAKPPVTVGNCSGM